MRKQREDQGMTQAEVAVWIGRSTKTYGRYERGIQQMKILDLLKFRDLMQEDPLEIAFPLSRQADPEKALSSAEELQQQPWFGKLKEFRQRRLDERKRFEHEVYSSFGRRWHTANSTFFTSATFAACFRMFAIQYDLPYGTPVGAIDWSLGLSFGSMCLLMPVQIIDLIRFFKWCRHER